MALDLPASYQKIETCEIVIFFLKIFADLSLIKHRFLTIFQKMIYKNTTVNHIFSILCLYPHFLKILSSWNGFSLCLLSKTQNKIIMEDVLKTLASK